MWACICLLTFVCLCWWWKFSIMDDLTLQNSSLRICFANALECSRSVFWQGQWLGLKCSKLLKWMWFKNTSSLLAVCKIFPKCWRKGRSRNVNFQQLYNLLFTRATVRSPPEYWALQQKCCLEGICPFWRSHAALCLQQRKKPIWQIAGHSKINGRV